MQHPSVKELFREQIKHYSKPKQATDSLVIDHFKNWVREKRTKRVLRICEFGGGAGQLLTEIGKCCPHAQLTNAEIMADYRKYLVSKKVRFVERSILNSGFPDKSFDVLIIRDLLHHLVGENYQQTEENQLKALQELKRLARPGGAIFIDELTNESVIATRLIYFLCQLNAKVGVNLPVFQVTPQTIVAFLTPEKLRRLCREVFDKDDACREFSYKVKVNLASKLLHFGANLRREIFLIERR